MPFLIFSRVGFQLLPCIFIATIQFAVMSIKYFKRKGIETAWAVAELCPCSHLQGESLIAIPCRTISRLD